MFVISNNAANQPSSFGTDNPLQKASRKYCALAGTALQCHDIASGGTDKYNLPSYVGFASRIVPSPDEQYYFIEVPVNPLPTKPDGVPVAGQPAVRLPAKHLYVANNKFEVVRELAYKDDSRYVDVDWAADGKSLIYAEQKADASTSTIYVYDVKSAKSRELAKNVDVATLFVSADGNKLIVSDQKSAREGSLGLSVIDFASGSRQNLDTTGLKKQLKYYANYSYDRIHDRLYVVGSNDKGPALAIAKPIGSDKVSVAVLRIVDDGYAYTPLTALDSGMFVARLKGAEQQYGALADSGIFTASNIKPTQKARFGVHNPPDIQKAGNTAAEAADYVHGYVAIPDGLRSFLAGLASKDCSEGSFNSVSLLANDNSRQLAVGLDNCNGGSKLQYFVADGSGGGFRLAFESIGLPLCSDVRQNGLSEVVAPFCRSTY